MADSVELMQLRLETAMLSELFSSVSGSGTDDGSGVSFDSMLSEALGASGGVSGLSELAPFAASSFAAGTPAAGTAAGRQTASPQILSFIENHEGFAATPYRGLDYWNETTGYGHVVQPGEACGSEALTRGQAESMLKSDLVPCEESVNKEFAGTNLSQNQFDALVSFSYGLGTNIWSKTPKLVSDIKSGASADVLKQDFVNCAHVGGKLPQGLVNRRLDEWQVFCTGTYPELP